MLIKTPKPPYYIVVFTSRMNENIEGYAETSKKMLELAKEAEGFLGIESARSDIGITVTYWKDLASIRKWGANAEHLKAKQKGKSDWYKEHITRIALVEKEY